jgi:superfamily II DNA or RNA helicase
MSVILRPYQDASIDGLRGAYAEGAQAPLLVSPTASGKTVIFSAISQRAVAKGGQVLVLAHRQELIRQTSAKLTEFAVAHGLILPGEPATDQPVQVASVQTLVRRLDRLAWTPSLVIVDECHHAVPGTGHGKILAHFSAARVLGVTATPSRLDGRGLGIQVGGYFDRLVMGPTVAELIALGYLARPVVFAPPGAPDLSGLHTVGGDFNRGELDAVMNRRVITGNAIEHYGKHCPGEPALCFCVSVEHARGVAQAFSDAGYQAESIDGSMDDKTRAQRITDLAEGRLQVLTSCEIVSEGTDIPVVVAAILLRPTKSLALYLQQVGRVLRIYPGKTRALILDHVGNVHRHGLPDEERQWDLNATKKRREGEAKMPTRECPNCHCVSRVRPVCAECGYRFPVATREVEEVVGNLVEIKPGDRRLAAKRERAMCRTLDELRDVAARYGYRAGWAEHIWRARQARQQRWQGQR